MKMFVTAVLGLSFALGPGVYAQATGGSTDKQQVNEKRMTKTDKTKSKGGDDKGGKRGKGKGQVTKAKTQ